ncbi:MAG: hypothetical protein DI598_11440 [Pseudopedobacter saltans]|uniref:Transcriptional regulator n=1 Tax=Pseudopedobacter saltans TaxID=151895 RepID=A0A2W5EUP8_9SPHI|nr:MAG: hypothetical protein DI598_11440 [Pseudopedobacter saltans]
MSDITFTEWWKTLPPGEKYNVAMYLAKECNTALSTIKTWGLGYRTPKSRSQDIIVKFLTSKGLQSDTQTLFPS